MDRRQSLTDDQWFGTEAHVKNIKTGEQVA